MFPTRPLAVAALVVIVVAPAALVTAAGTPGSVSTAATPGLAHGSADAASAGADRDRVGGGPSPTVESPDGVVEPESNTTNYLDIGNQHVVGNGYARSEVDVLGAVERDVAEIRSNYTALSFEYENANRSDGETVTGIRSEVDRVERRIDELTARYDRALERYGAGEWTTDRFLRELAILDAIAGGLEYRLDSLGGAVRPELPKTLTDRISSLELDLVEFQGPVRRNVGEAMDGTRDPFVTYVVTGTDGVVLSRTDDLFAYREAYVGGNRAEEGPNNLVSNEDLKGLRNAINRVGNLYPWTWSNTALPSFDIRKDAAYRFALNHPHGLLGLYLDGRTTNVFREIQRPQTDRLPTESVANVTDDVAVRINRTYGTGPMEVTVTDGSGTPLNASVTVNEFRVGSTGDDGRLWTITPYQDVRVVVETAAGRRVTISFVAD